MKKKLYKLRKKKNKFTNKLHNNKQWEKIRNVYTTKISITRPMEDLEHREREPSISCNTKAKKLHKRAHSTWKKNSKPLAKGLATIHQSKRI